MRSNPTLAAQTLVASYLAFSSLLSSSSNVSAFTGSEPIIIELVEDLDRALEL